MRSVLPHYRAGMGRNEAALPMEPPRITLSRVNDLAAIGEHWRELEDRVDCSFFQSWTWTGCRIEERFADPVLLAAEAGGRTRALALFNRRRGWLGADHLWLGESGIPELDAVFIEHNGVLAERGQRDFLLRHCLRAALALRLAPLPGRNGRQLVLSGVDADHLRAARASGIVRLRHTRRAPFVDCAAIRARGSYLDLLSANTRYQIRRSARRYAAIEPLAIRRAETIAEAHDFLAALAALHQERWRRRGEPGAFANPRFVRFHQSLIERAMAARQVDLLRIGAGDAAIGYLYNFRFRNRVLAYQSGFDYDAAGPHRKPGLTSHHLAIEMCAAEGIERYDFLAGADRYKLSLSTGSTELHWLELSPRWSASGLLSLARQAARRLVRHEASGSAGTEPPP
jgi:CelD/BcsL family acetyltransferase involved in cellulose biosynthesis